MRNPEDVADRFVAAWNQSDPQGIADLFEEDADFVNVVGLWWSSRHRIMQAHSYGLETIFANSRMEVVRTKVRRLSQVSITHLHWRMEGQTTPEGETGDPREGVMSFVLVQGEDGTWKVVSAQNTDIHPGTETYVAELGKLTAREYR